MGWLTCGRFGFLNGGDEKLLLCICNERYFLTEKLEAAGEVNGEEEAGEGPHGGHGHAAPRRHSGLVRTAPGCRLLLDQTVDRDQVAWRTSGHTGSQKMCPCSCS